MTKRNRKCRIWVWLLMAPATLVSGVILHAQKQPAATASSYVSGPAPAEAKAAAQSAKAPPRAMGVGDYVGTETCVGCHTDQQRRFKNTVMGKIFARPRTELEKLGCESCHGPGKAHVDSWRRQGHHPPPLRQGFQQLDRRAKRRLLSVPFTRQPAVLEGQPARIARDGLRGLPPGEAGAAGLALVRHPLQRSADREPGGQEVAAGTLSAVSPDAPRTVAALLAHAVSRRQGDVHELSQPARHSQPEAVDSEHGQRELPHLPYRASWSFPVGAPAGDGKLRQLP